MKRSNTILTAAMLALVFSSSVFANLPEARDGAYSERSDYSAQMRGQVGSMMFGGGDGQHTFERSGR